MKTWIIVFATAIIFVLLLRGFVFTPYTIPSMGMENALYEGDRIIANKLSYRNKSPKPGDLVVFNNPISDKKEAFISRCVGVPGDTLLLDTLFNAISGWARSGPDRKNLYSYSRYRERQMDSLLNVLSITNNYLMGGDADAFMRSFSRYEYYLIEQALGEDNWVKCVQFQDTSMVKQLIVPGTGKTVTFENWNLTLYRNTILLHEGKQAEIINDSLFIEGQPANSFTFTKNYYWMMSNNTINMADSRLFGFVPAENLIGKAAFIWFSKEPCTGLFEGFRWERIFFKL
ncbi:signal peptidase I [Bacteroides sp. 519]|uniref:signal peptidase I n=1 Tax=Bacteroides sp. 519 TaxID=2302937 RepID=UPI0013D7C5CD|nr:signal peptidase I [Bacteroides sp. 519]NDV58018.1 signal peptidase I [Bacteroides sp. 519]